MNATIRLATLLLISLVLTLGCRNKTSDQRTQIAGSTADSGKKGKVAVAHITPAKAAATQPSFGTPTGTVTFTQMGDRVKVVADLTGLPPGKHGFHIHEKGDLSAPDLMSTGGHFNPGGHPHGGPTTSPVHAGDFGNIVADSSGSAHLELIVDDISIGTGEKNDILGKPVIVHAKADDLRTQPSGNAGARIGGGLIEPAK